MADDRREVVVTDIKIPFWSMVVLLVKWAIAALPAVFIVFFLAAALSTALGMIFGDSWYHWGSGKWM